VVGNFFRMPQERCYLAHNVGDAGDAGDVGRVIEIHDPRPAPCALARPEGLEPPTF
jgi:hypothetical protein